MKRITIGNDIWAAWQIVRGDLLEQLDLATDMRLLVHNRGGSREIPFELVENSTLVIDVTPEIANATGDYRFELSYILPHLSAKDGNQKCRVTVNAFTIVGLTEDADEITELTLQSDVLIGLRGAAFVSENFTEEEWTEIQRPAVEAAQIANAAAENANNKASAADTATGKANTAASNADTKAAAAQTAKENADSATTSANNAAANANNKASAADTATGKANTAASNADTKAAAAQTAKENADSATTAANDAATNASNKASVANTAAQNANNATSALNTKIGEVDTKMGQVDTKVQGYETALNTKSGEVDTKIQAVTTKTTELETAVDTKIQAVTTKTTELETAVDNKIQAIETEAVTWRQDEQSRKDAETNREDTYNSKLDKIDPQTGLEVRELIFSNHHYGIAVRRWNINNASPIGEAVGDIPTLRDLPKILGLGCYLVQKDHSRRKLDPTDHYKFADDGTPAALDGSMGDYMWGWNKPFYYATWIEGDYEYEAVSLKPIRGRENYPIPVGSTSALGLPVVDRVNLELVSVINDSPQYRGGNNNATLDDKFNTQLGRYAGSLNQETYGAYARKKGLGWEAYWYAHVGIINALTRIIMGTRHLQAAVNPNKDANGLYQGGLGIGVSNAGAWWGTDFANYHFFSTSVGVELGDGCGEVPFDVIGADDVVLQTMNVPVFFGLKNLFGVIYKQERGLVISKDAQGFGDIYVVKNSHQTYNSASLDGLIKVATIPPDNGDIKQLSMHHLCHKPISHGGSATTYYADYQYNNNTPGLRASLVGGYANIGGYVGPECLRSNTAVSHAYAYYGSPLCESEKAWDTSPLYVD